VQTLDVPQGTLEAHRARWDRLSFAVASVLEGT
jgi:hypothetical protein